MHSDNQKGGGKGHEMVRDMTRRNGRTQQGRKSTTEERR